jgi:tetratricopeptide (TPR) repeat protein
MRSSFIFGVIAGVAALTLAFEATGAEFAQRKPSALPDSTGYSLSPKTKLSPTAERRPVTVTLDRTVQSLLFAASAAQLSKDHDRAVSLLTRALRLNSDSAIAFIIYAYRGWVYYSKGELTKALSDYTAAIQLYPIAAVAYLDRGHVYRELGDNDKAINDFSEAIRLNPRYARAYLDRGSIYLRQRKFKQASKDYDAALAETNESEPQIRHGILNSVAWLRATFPEQSLRDGKQAVSEATRACELTKWKNWAYLDTLAGRSG